MRLPLRCSQPFPAAAPTLSPATLTRGHAQTLTGRGVLWRRGLTSRASAYTIYVIHMPVSALARDLDCQ